MEKRDFSVILASAISGNEADIEYILKMYAPLIDRNSYLKGQLDEDLRQYILMHIVKNISKFKI